MSKKIKKYRYNFAKLIFTILLLPLILLKSKKGFKLYRDFCYIYPRSEKERNFNEFPNIKSKLNCLEYHYWDLKKMNLKAESFKEKDIEHYTLITEKGNISCIRAKNTNSKNWVIALHGWTEDKFLALRLVYHYFKKGYNILSFDAFAHGDSYGNYTDIGYSSIEMLDEIIIDLKNKNNIENIGLIGNSMGASTSILYSQKGLFKKEISWVIADCGFSNIKYQYRYYIQNNFFKKAWWLNGLGFTKRFSRITKTNQNKYNLIKNMKLNNQTPIFFIHAIGDTFIPYEMSLDMYNKKISFEVNKKSSLWTPIGSEHVSVITDYNKEYINRTLDFSKESEKIKNEK
ncbi:alpha/beta hydrolase [Spiroplasma cantharicola]|uniref:Putative hydrolase n=1 Tax=Spiroplasma cantharicola TaxID=362837 RepID=A0A0M4JJ50_9MOLU|nr:alpha/beta hydrolase [Spiroplasma cantharicola]ALD66149.1 putative hydrolase [Spiroplasma cantharicola]